MACLKLKGRRCLVVGGGEVGLEKVDGLLACDGDVTLIAPDAVPELVAYAEEGSIKWERRSFEDSDLDGSFLAIAATSDTDVNISVSEGRSAGRCWCVVDVPRSATSSSRRSSGPGRSRSRSRPPAPPRRSRSG